MRLPWLHRSQAPDPDRYVAVVCVRALLDACAIPYVMREIVPIRARLASSAKVREAAVLVRRLRVGWIALGTYARGRVPEDEARELIERWRTPIVPADSQGDATLVTLIVESTNSLVLDGVAVDTDAARAELEALSSVYTEDVIDAELVADGQRVRAADARALLVDPRLHEAPVHAAACCLSCGLPLGPLAGEIDRCCGCAGGLAA